MSNTEKNRSLQKSLIMYFLFSILIVVLSFSILLISLVYVLDSNDILSFQAIIKLGGTDDPSSSITLLVNLYFIAQVLIIFFSIKIFTKMVKKRVTTPVDIVTQGLHEITSGNLKTRLNFETEYEFVEIRDSFNFMAQKIEEADKEKKQYEEERVQLFANIAHDLKTPITSITGYSQALSSGMIEDPQKMNQFLHAIHVRSNQINELLDLMLEYTKLGSNLPPSEMADIDIVEVLREVVASNYTDIEEAGMEVEFNFPEDQMICRMNKLEISRALNNLIANAIRHNPPRTKIVVQLKIVKGNIIITIADTGSPIPLHLKKDLFKPFVLGDDSRSKGGSGLGLAIVDKLITRNNGSISLESGGNEFTKCFVIKFKNGFGKTDS